MFVLRVSSLIAAVVALAVASPRPLPAQNSCVRATLPAYAHNDYRNERPLHDAVERGFRGVEVDLFLVDGKLRTGHNVREARRSKTFEEMYLAPLRSLASKCQPLTGISAPFFLAVELKQDSPAAYAELRRLLEKYREMFAVGSIPESVSPVVELVLVGWRPPTAASSDNAEHLLRWQHRLTRPGRVDMVDRAGRVRLLSVDYGKTMGSRWRTAAYRRRWLETLRAAHDSAPGRLLRVHNVPVDKRLYELLLGAGVDLIGTEELERSRRLLSP